jgi:hypothetical protein
MRTYLVQYLTRTGLYKQAIIKSDIISNAVQTFFEKYKCQELIGVIKIG